MKQSEIKKSLQDIYETLKASTEQCIKQYKLKPDRADVLVPAAEIFLEIATHIKATSELLYLPSDSFDAHHQ